MGWSAAFDEAWLSVGQAARIAQVDPSTIRRWADRQLVLARVTPGGTRQIARSSLKTGFDRETSARVVVSNGGASGAGPDPYTAVVHLARSGGSWRGWRPNVLDTERLEELRQAIDTLEDNLADIADAIDYELHVRDEQLSNDL